MRLSTEEVVAANKRAHELLLVRKITKTNRINNQITNSISERTILPGLITDTHHTFDELYHQRAMLFLSICRLHTEHASMFLLDQYKPIEDNVVVLCLITPLGNIMQQYDSETYWHIFHKAGICVLKFDTQKSYIWEEKYRNDPDLIEKLNSIMFPD